MGIVYVYWFVVENFVDWELDEQEYILYQDYDKSNNNWMNFVWVIEEEWKVYQKKNLNYKGRLVWIKNYKFIEIQV